MSERLKYRWVKRVAGYLPAVLLGLLAGAGGVYVASESPMLLEVRLGEKEKHFVVDSRSTPNLCLAGFEKPLSQGVRSEQPQSRASVS